MSKDTIKEALMTVLDVPDVAASRQMGRAAVAALLAAAADAGFGVVESAWHRSRAASDLLSLPGSIVEVFCRCDRTIAQDRYRSRAGTRAPGHFDEQRVADELWNDEVAMPIAGGWPVLEVDTNQAVDVHRVVGAVRGRSPEGAGTPRTVGNSS
jgi:hypothetical protein